jgi:excisionase family DNA binding protein
LVSAGGGPAAPVPERYLTVREVAKLLHVATSTVYKLCAEGKLAHVRVSNAIRVHPSAVEASLAASGPRSGPTK